MDFTAIAHTALPAAAAGAAGDGTRRDRAATLIAGVFIAAAAINIALH